MAKTSSLDWVDGFPSPEQGARAIVTDWDISIHSSLEKEYERSSQKAS